MLVFGIEYGVVGITWSVALSGIIWWVISATVNNKLLGYGLLKQLRDVIPYFITSLILSLVIYCIMNYILAIHSVLGELLLSIVLFSVGYLIISGLIGFKPYKIYESIVKNYITSRVIKRSYLT